MAGKLSLLLRSRSEECAGGFAALGFTSFPASLLMGIVAGLMIRY